MPLFDDAASGLFYGQRLPGADPHQFLNGLLDALGRNAARNWIKSEFERYSTECGGSAKSSNRFSFRHSSRKRPLKLST